MCVRMSTAHHMRRERRHIPRFGFCEIHLDHRRMMSLLMRRRASRDTRHACAHRRLLLLLSIMMRRHASSCALRRCRRSQPMMRHFIQHRNGARRQGLHSIHGRGETRSGRVVPISPLIRCDRRSGQGISRRDGVWHPVIPMWAIAERLLQERRRNVLLWVLLIQIRGRYAAWCECREDLG